MASELPYETYQRLTGKKWTSGKSADIRALLAQFEIKAPAGSEQANLELQRAMKSAGPLFFANAPEPRIPSAPDHLTNRTLVRPTPPAGEDLTAKEKLEVGASLMGKSLKKAFTR